MYMILIQVGYGNSNQPQMEVGVGIQQQEGKLVDILTQQTEVSSVLGHQSAKATGAPFSENNLPLHLVDSDSIPTTHPVVLVLSFMIARLNLSNVRLMTLAVLSYQFSNLFWNE